MTPSDGGVVIMSKLVEQNYKEKEKNFKNILKKSRKKMVIEEI